MKTISLLALVSIAYLASTAEGYRTLLSTTEIEWRSGISKSCQQVCENPLVFSSAFSNQPASFSCRINLDNGEVAPGYQAGDNTCHAAYYNTPVQSTNYDCGCLPQGQLPGLDASVGNGCTNSCTKSLDGSSGTALVDGVGHICLPRSEMGSTNHFGYTDSGTCIFSPADNPSNGPYSTDQFSCVCSFASPQTSAKLTPTNSSAQSAPSNG